MLAFKTWTMWSPVHSNRTILPLTILLYKNLGKFYFYFKMQLEDKILHIAHMGKMISQEKFKSEITEEPNKENA